MSQSKLVQMERVVVTTGMANDASSASNVSGNSSLAKQVEQLNEMLALKICAAGVLA